jgi:hypothetical protein
VFAGEQEGRAFPAEVRLERRAVALQFGLQVGVGRLIEELDRRLEVVGTCQQAAPRVDLGTEAVGLAEDLLRRPLVVPESGLERQRVELRDALGLGVEVKVAPRSTGSVRPGRGWRTRPLVPGLEILEQDRPQLDEPKGRLAPCDDGVHAGTVGVVRAHAAVAVTVEGRCIAARAAISLARDQIDERGVLGLLHGLPPVAALGHKRAGLGADPSRNAWWSCFGGIFQV